MEMKSYRPLYRWMREAEMLATWFENIWALSVLSVPWDINKHRLLVYIRNDFANYQVTGVLMCAKELQLTFKISYM